MLNHIVVMGRLTRDPELRLDKIIRDYLGGITLQDVLDRHNVGNDYVI